MEQMPAKFSKDEAFKALLGTLAEMEQTGAVDSERDAVAELLEKLDKDKITSDEAVRRVRKLQAGRQDYH